MPFVDPTSGTSVKVWSWFWWSCDCACVWGHKVVVHSRPQKYVHKYVIVVIQ